MSEIYVVTSGKGGVGKTTTTANLGMGLAMRGKKVVLVDTDTGLRNLDLLLGLENRIMYDLIDVTEGRVAYKKALVRHKKYDNLFLLPTSQVKDKMAVNPEQLVKLCDDLRKEFDYIIIDCPAGIEQGFKTAIAAADTALVVTMPEISAVRDADKIANLQAAKKDNHLREDIFYKQLSAKAKIAPLTSKVKEQFFTGKTVLSATVQTFADRLLQVISWIYDFNYEYTKTVFLNQGYAQFLFDELAKYHTDKTELKKIKEIIKL